MKYQFDLKYKTRDYGIFNIRVILTWSATLFSEIHVRIQYQAVVYNWDRIRYPRDGAGYNIKGSSRKWVRKYTINVFDV